MLKRSVPGKMTTALVEVLVELDHCAERRPFPSRKAPTSPHQQDQSMSYGLVGDRDRRATMAGRLPSLREANAQGERRTDPCLRMPGRPTLTFAFSWGGSGPAMLLMNDHVREPSLFTILVPPSARRGRPSLPVRA